MDTESSIQLLTPFTLDLLLRALIFIFLLGCSALISGSETALFSLSSTEIEEEAEKDSSSIIVQLLRRPQKLLATLLIANNLVNISIVLVFDPLGDFLFENMNEWVRAIFEVGILTFVILLCGEILPKIYANRNNLAFARGIAPIIKVLDICLTPVSAIMTLFTSFINDKLHKRSSISVGQLSQALELTSQEDTTREEHKILSGIVSFGNTDIRAVMHPRIDISAIDDTMSYKEVLAFIQENGYSRVPVYQDNIDNITGIIYAKDLLPYLDQQEFDWRRIKRKAFFVPENKKLDDLLSEFQQKKIHLAIVVDEYGGTSGVITLEDVIEEIVGEISDEYDSEDTFYTKLDENNFLFDGKTPLKDFYRVLAIEEEIQEKFEKIRGDSETIAGFLLELIEAFPEKKQEIPFENYLFTIESIDKKRIKQLKVTIR
ncbi:gliding motility-associated protein GldE [Capnocytophaga sp. oral taxon 863]|uniref:gliding motility-associated protein GldE n=1 Tax=Capnocytophaga sp. oral taxon 863 TaxID=1227265 RepID=UPI000688ABDE|nr:gliding motility-associated protein GldE [Capnocytophaga sp. oral taxon 863]